jgi:hypothetical protein
MEDDLKMKGSTPLNIAIFAFGCLVFGGTMYGLTRSSADEKQDHALEQAAKQAGGGEAKQGPAKDDKGEFAKMEAGAPEGAQANGAAGVQGGDPAATGTSAPAGDAPAPASAPSGGSAPPPQPQAASEPASPPPTDTASASPIETASAAAEPSAAAPSAASQPEPSTAAAATPAAEAAAESTASPGDDDGAKHEAAKDVATNDAAKSDDKPYPKPTSKPRPSVMGVLTPWWQPSQSSPFNVQFVGRSVDDKKIVAVFSDNVDAAAAADKIKVVDAKGRPVATSWQQGESPRVLVNGDLKPGRYLVMIDSSLAGAGGQPIGVPVHGPVVLQPDSQQT